MNTSTCTAWTRSVGVTSGSLVLGMAATPSWERQEGTDALLPSITAVARVMASLGSWIRMATMGSVGVINACPVHGVRPRDRSGRETCRRAQGPPLWCAAARCDQPRKNSPSWAVTGSVPDVRTCEAETSAGFRI